MTEDVDEQRGGGQAAAVLARAKLYWPESFENTVTAHQASSIPGLRGKCSVSVRYVKPVINLLNTVLFPRFQKVMQAANLASVPP